MSDERKNSLKYSSSWIFCIAFLVITFKVSGNYLSPPKFYNALTTICDTVPQTGNPALKTGDTIPKIPRDTIPKKYIIDSLGSNDSTFKKTDTFNVQLSKDTLDAPINYTASDSIVFMVPEKKVILFSEATVKKGDMDLAADSISIDQDTKLITATYRKDTAGRMIG